MDSTVANYCRFLRRARRHIETGHRDEAFLHFVIALDLLFGLDGNSAESVSRRSAMVVYRALGNSLFEQHALIKRLYDARSKYVHEGTPPSAAQLNAIAGVCREVLWALLRTQQESMKGTTRAARSEEWLRHLDYLFAAIEAGKPPSESEFSEAGIAMAGRTHPLGIEWESAGLRAQ